MQSRIHFTRKQGQVLPFAFTYIFILAAFTRDERGLVDAGYKHAGMTGCWPLAIKIPRQRVTDNCSCIASISTIHGGRSG